MEFVQAWCINENELCTHTDIKKNCSSWLGQFHSSNIKKWLSAPSKKKRQRENYILLNGLSCTIIIIFQERSTMEGKIRKLDSCTTKRYSLGCTEYYVCMVSSKYIKNLWIMTFIFFFLPFNIYSPSSSYFLILEYKK